MSASPTLLDRAKAYLQTDIEQLTRVRNTLDPAVEEAVAVLTDCVRSGGKIIFAGIGKSYHLGAKAAATFTSTGSTAVLLHPAEAPHGDLGLLRDGDTVILLSYSGESREMVHLVPFLRRARVKLISITGSADNRLARLADLSIAVGIEREACPFNLAPTASALVTLAVCDTLAMLVQEELGFTREAYGRLHPGGSIGDSLTLRVSDVMRSGARLPVCRAGQSVQDAVLVMTRCKSGAVGILGPDGKLAGVYTDGDLRRTLTRTSDIAACALGDCMIRDPVRLAPDATIREALDVFSRHNIDDLLVVDADGVLVGILDLQDLPKLKLLNEG
jgi:arabinose-5-phosphate isomerase